MDALASKGPGGARCEPTADQLRVLEQELAARPAAHGWDEDQRWTLARIAHQQLGGPIVLVWDNLNTHRGAAMRELVATRPWPSSTRSKRCGPTSNQAWPTGPSRPSTNSPGSVMGPGADG
ncbi:hypothetical protein [Allokutzneria oryzae]|uniref:Tc1-like transposase DDE domain-containing protein n=1 Tax=Allokutzneria oryzae TaxID=1378989 RepID=A0ABV6A3X3_9PSEU